MQNKFIIVKEYCEKSNIDPTFIELLADEGLIDLEMIEGSVYILESQLHDLDRYIRWHYDLSVNIAGIDVIRHLLAQMNDMQEEIRLLRKKLSAFPDTDEEAEY